MWMGGRPPLGYDIPLGGSRTLTVNSAEAETVRRIFALYLELGSVHALGRQLREEGIRSKQYITAKGHVRGGANFSRGALFHLLRNRLYLGEIIHRDQSHPGLHSAIIDQDIFEAVQAKLEAQTRRHMNGGKASTGSKTHSPLVGRIFDGDGQPMSPAFAYGRGGRLYRYYVSASLQRGGKKPPADTLPRRVSATIVEAHLTASLTRLFPTPPSKPQPVVPLALISRVEVHASHITIILPAKLRSSIEAQLSPGETATPDHDDPAKLRLMLPFRVSSQRGKTELIAGNKCGPCPNPALIRALRQAHALLGRDATGAFTITTAPTSTYQRRLICLAFLAPDIQDAILSGRQPAGLALGDLMDRNLRPLWSDQRVALGFPAVG